MHAYSIPNNKAHSWLVLIIIGKPDIATLGLLIRF